MIITRRFPLRTVIIWGSRVAILAGLWAAVVFGVFAVTGWRFIAVPFLPIATIGTAVAFYIGFKNNSAYDRFWEGRKIWGGIVNASRTWATAAIVYSDPGEDDERARATRRTLLYRQLAWINALRLQLRRTSRFHDKPSPTTRRRLDRDAAHMRNDWDTELAPFLTPAELAEVSAKANPATQLLARQASELRDLALSGRLDMFRQIELMGVIRELFELQGRCERIKNTPFPRPYAEFSRIFTRVFVFLLPFGLLDVFADHVREATTTFESVSPVIPMILASTLVSWVFATMEGIGDSSEDPFERSMNDVPMNALCRTIEIDVREMLGETSLPPKEAPAGIVLY
ncbi:MAG: hypothetical protein KC420_20605 [Myxococcales bacterium]|nr:hypothetical protein [Myxococcales bacterium]